MTDTAVGTAPLPARVGGADGAGAARNLAFATLAFGLCFCAFGLIAPLATKFEEDLGLSSTEALLLTAVPVVLGSLLRLPIGALTVWREIEGSLAELPSESPTSGSEHPSDELAARRRARTAG
mgnify:CR=1 FL=1